MEPNEASRHRKREYVVVKHGQAYYYARASRQDPDMYVIMAKVSHGEGKEIVEKSNRASDMNHAIDQLIETGAKFQNNWKPKEEDDEVGIEASNRPL